MPSSSWQPVVSAASCLKLEAPFAVASHAYLRFERGFGGSKPSPEAGSETRQGRSHLPTRNSAQPNQDLNDLNMKHPGKANPAVALFGHDHSASRSA